MTYVHLCFLCRFDVFLVCHFTQDSPCLVFNSYESIKEDIENVWLNNFSGDEVALDLKECFPGEDLILTELIDEIHNAETSTEVFTN